MALVLRLEHGEDRERELADALMGLSYLELKGDFFHRVSSLESRPPSWSLDIIRAMQPQTALKTSGLA